MSLNVSPELLEVAKAGPVSDEEFLACVRDSLPYAWKVVDQLVSDLGTTGNGHAVDRTNPPSDKDQGELLRLMASSPMRQAVERHYGIKLEFQNCCSTGAFRPEAVGGAAHQEFISARAQLLNQSPELLNC
ncbi:hypothetical protein Rhe02_39270 [Rhizocola hellebori]|uniref:Uncharacterized protein n=1 Tax=Rhizocola hellebori TaxID=1392758 RepID=A0A8J3VGV4_9ACTN|nr:SCO5389 family protein [Rhizocola hellebori]GIH05860.1 hypothetical protein Rhe02_39270 [Rhizocola hellebori]